MYSPSYYGSWTFEDPRIVYPPGGGSGGFPFPGGGGGSPIPGGGGGIPFPGGGGGSPSPGVGGGGTGGAPQSPPPQQIPPKPQTQGGYAYLVDPVVLQGCLFNWTRVWDKNGNNFWFWPNVIGSNSIGGYTWNHYTNQIGGYVGIDTKLIDAFNCSF